MNKFSANSFSSSWLGGATVARLTPDQKVACSNHVGVIAVKLFALKGFEY